MSEHTTTEGLDTNRLRNWARAYQRLTQGGHSERAHTACVNDFADDEGEYPYITADDVLALVSRIESAEAERDAARAEVEALRERVGALIRAAEYRTATSLGRDFTGRPFQSPVPLEDLRAALDADHKGDA